MIKIDNKKVNIDHFPDGTQRLIVDKSVRKNDVCIIEWVYEKEEELSTLIYVTKHLREHGVKELHLFMHYIPNARMDRVKDGSEVFTLKHFADVINWLDFDRVVVADPHSTVSEALFKNISIAPINVLLEQVLHNIGEENNLVLYFPDAGAVKRYAGQLGNYPFVYGEKNRDWKSGKILGLELRGDTSILKGKNVLMIDDICSKGGTFYYGAKALRALGVNKIYLYVTHCENTIHDGELLKGDLIERVYTSNTLVREPHEKIETHAFF